MPPAATASAVPDALDAYARATAPAGDAARDALAVLARVGEGWDGFDAGAVAAARAAAERAAALDRWVARVAEAFRAADGATPPVHVRGLPPVPGLDPITAVPHDGPTRVLRLALDDLPAADWPAVVAGWGLADGPLHLVVHGWGGGTAGAERAGRATAEVHDREGGPGATVLVVDWDAGEGSHTDWWDIPGDFRSADASARRTGVALAGLLSAVAAADPDAAVALTGHSLGARVVADAVGGLDDPTGRFSVDVLAAQAALSTEDVEDGPLAGPRVAHLALTVDRGDDALFWYELLGPEALGDEAPDGEALQALLRARALAGLSSRVVAHGDGHLGLAPDHPAVATLTEDLVTRLHD